MFRDICAYIIHLRRNHNQRNIYISAEELPDGGFVIMHNSILLPSFHGQHCDLYLHPSNDDSSDTEADSENACIDPEQPLFQTRSYVTLQLDNQPASKRISDEYFVILDNEID